MLVAEWFETALRGYDKMSERIAQVSVGVADVRVVRVRKMPHGCQELEDTLLDTSSSSPSSPGAHSEDRSLAAVA